MNRIITYIMLLVSLVSCSEGGFFRTGEIITESRSFPVFKYVEIKNVFNVTLQQNTAPGIIIRAGEALIPGIETIVRNDTLFISNRNNFEWTRKYSRIDLIILTDSTKKITLDEPCDFKTEGVYTQDKFILWATNNLSQVDMQIDADYFQFANSWLNTGNYRIGGNARYAYLWINGTANLDASELIAEELYVEQRSIADMKINVIDLLTYNIKNSGNVVCYSDPVTIIESVHTGSGKLIFE